MTFLSEGFVRYGFAPVLHGRRGQRLIMITSRNIPYRTQGIHAGFCSVFHLTPID